MAFIDELKIHIKAGDGGNGVVRWLSEKGKEFMGPAGGNGGKGGNVYITAVRDSGLLFKYRHDKEFLAENGGHGSSKSRHGKDGEDLEIKLPIGSVVKNLSTEEEVDLLRDGQKELILKGGVGGYGNENFKSSTNRSPEEFTEGKEGEEANFLIELRLVADIGFVGLPNAGKSSLLNALTNSKAKVGDFNFTTLDPNLGSLYGIILADIPGIIEGASSGKGLGHKFLRHVRRTKTLLHCISVENENILKAYKTIRKELEEYNSELAEKEEIILLTKSDLVDEKKLKELKKDLKSISTDILDVTILDDDSVKKLSDALTSVEKI